MAVGIRGLGFWELLVGGEDLSSLRAENAKSFMQGDRFH